MNAAPIIVNANDSKTVLDQDAYLVAQYMYTGAPINVQAANLDANANAQYVMTQAQADAGQPAPTLGDNLQSADPTGLIKAAVDTYEGSGPPKGETLSQWVMAGAGNYSLIAFGAILALAALIYSQRDNVKTIVETAGKVAAVAA